MDIKGHKNYFKKTKLPIKKNLEQKFKEKINPIQESIKSTGNFSIKGDKLAEKKLNIDSKEKKD